jgi:alpha,alpha-trehalose phosphorylase
MVYRGACVEVATDGQTATYRTVDGGPMTVGHHGELIEVGDEPITRPIRHLPLRPRPHQPPGREPERRGID